VVTTTTTTYHHIRDQAESTLCAGHVSPAGGARSSSPKSAAQPVEHASWAGESVEHVSPPNTEPDLDVDHDEEAPLLFRQLDNVLGPTVVPGLAQRAFQEELHTVSVEEPVSLEEVARSPSWRAIMVEELRSIEENHTWDISDLVAGHRRIGLK
jgi:hypothetical protein